MIQHRAKCSPWDRGSSLTTSHPSSAEGLDVLPTLENCCRITVLLRATIQNQTHCFFQVRWFFRAQILLLRAKHSFSGVGSSSHPKISPLADCLEPRSRDHTTFPDCNAECHCRSPDILSTLPPSTKLTWDHIHLAFQQLGANILSWMWSSKKALVLQSHAQGADLHVPDASRDVSAGGILPAAITCSPGAEGVLS